MPFEPLISIVIPVYNGARYLGEAIDSALGQTYPRVEVLVVNDGSKDDGATEKLALSYGDRITYVAKPNGGVATALNEGIRRMRGDYFSWLSHDDVYFPNKLAAQVARLKDAPRDAILYGDVDYIDPEGAFLRRDEFARWAGCSMLAALVMAWPVNGCTILVPRAAFDDVGVFDETMATTQDYDLWFRLAAKYPFVHVAEPLIKSRLHPGQGTRTILLHAQEMNELYSRGLTMQTKESLLSLPGVRSMAGGYLEMARALTWRKRAFRASNQALRLAMRHRGGETVLDLALQPLSALSTLGANLSLALPIDALRRLRRYWALSKS